MNFTIIAGFTPAEQLLIFVVLFSVLCLPILLVLWIVRRLFMRRTSSKHSAVLYWTIPLAIVFVLVVFVMYIN